MRKKIIIDDIFLKNLPYLDLHGYTGDMARVATKDFIDDNLKLNNPKIIIVHGIGEGIVKKSVHEELSRNKNISSYYINSFNAGCTIVNLNLNK